MHTLQLSRPHYSVLPSKQSSHLSLTKNKVEATMYKTYTASADGTSQNITALYPHQVLAPAEQSHSPYYEKIT